MAEVVLCAASTMAGCLVAPAGRLCGYVISNDSHVGELEDKVAGLRNAKQEVQHSIDDAQNNVKPIKAHVKEWVEKVEKHAKEARRFLDDCRRAPKTCFCGWLPNPKVRFCLGREARRKSKHIQRLIDRKPSGEVYNDPPPGLVVGASDVISLAGDRGYIMFESRNSIFQGMMEALNDENVKVVGVYGPGGVGKSTLLEMAEENLRKEGRLFHMIVKAEVSQTPDLNNIQGQIADSLGLNLKDKQSRQGRRDHLLRRLRMKPNEKVPIILDDVWGALDLKAVGIPLGDESRNCKFLLTSRDKSVLEQKLHAEQTFHLEPLSFNETFSFLAKIVGDKLTGNEELILNVDPELKKLEGLPLNITTFASLLKSCDVSTWKDIVMEIKDPNIENGEPELCQTKKKKKKEKLEL